MTCPFFPSFFENQMSTTVQQLTDSFFNSTHVLAVTAKDYYQIEVTNAYK